MKLKVWPFGFAIGAVWGLMVFLATAIILIKGGGGTLRLLAVFYWGYEVSWNGSLIGFAWAFINGAVAGGVIALIYNWLVGKKEA
jgi:hypothetical protein